MTLRHPNNYLLVAVALFLCVAVARAADSGGGGGAGGPTYDDQVRAVFSENCFGCHNPDKRKADLDLTTYSTLLTGSSSGKIVAGGKPDDSTLYLVLSHQQEPYMPPNKPKLPDAQLELIKKWIEAGIKENAGSKAQVVQSKVSLALAPSARGKPKGAPPMPGLLPLEPIVHTARLNCPIALAHSPWAPLAAVGGQHQILLYNSGSRELLGVLPFPEGFPDAMTFSRSGTILLAAGGRGAAVGRAVLFDVATGRRVATLGQEYDAILAADISPDQTSVAIGGPGKLVKVLAIEDGKPRYTIKKHTDWILSLAFSPDGVLLASGDRGGNLYVWEARTGENFYELRGHTGAVTALSWRSDSNVLASASEDGTVRLWEMNGGSQVKSWQANPGGVEDVRYGPDGKLVTAGRDHAVKIWDGEGRLLRAYSDLPDLATRATFNQDAKTVIGGDWTGRLKEWPVDAEKPVGELDPNPPTLAMRVAAVDEKIVKARAEAAAIAPDDAAAAALRLSAKNAALELAATQQQLQQFDHPSAATRPAATQPAASQPHLVTAADRPALVKSIATLTDLAHTRAEKVARLDQAVGALAALSQELARWQKSQLFQSLYDARLRLADVQAQALRCRQAAGAALEAVQPAADAAVAVEKAAAQSKDTTKKARDRVVMAETALAQAKVQLSLATAQSKAADAQLALATEDVDDLAAQWNGAPPRRHAVAATQPIVRVIAPPTIGILGRTVGTIERLADEPARVITTALGIAAVAGSLAGLLASARCRKSRSLQREPAIAETLQPVGLDANR